MHSKELCYISVIFLSLKDVILSISTYLTAYLQKIKINLNPNTTWNSIMYLKKFALNINYQWEQVN